MEHLKSVIKSCGMRYFFYLPFGSKSELCQAWHSNISYFFCSVPPVIYKKVKQVSENKREAQLIKELEDILSREGLSSNPSEKGGFYH